MRPLEPESESSRPSSRHNHEASIHHLIIVPRPAYALNKSFMERRTGRPASSFTTITSTASHAY